MVNTIDDDPYTLPSLETISLCWKSNSVKGYIPIVNAASNLKRLLLYWMDVIGFKQCTDLVNSVNK